MRTPLLLGLFLVAGALAGCLGGDGFEDHYDPADGKYHFERTADGQLVHFDWAPGGIGKVWNKGEAPVTVTLPRGFLLVDGAEGLSGSFQVPPAEGLDLVPGETRFHLAPPGAETVDLQVGEETFPLDPTGIRDFTPSNTHLLQGEAVWDLSAFQEANFPHREPGHPNYWASIQYFSDFFDALGYEVEVDPYGTHDASAGGAACVEARGGTICPESLANVVATKPGTGDTGRSIFVAGGHFDMVSGTTHAAFDDTSGVVATMELARAMAPYDFANDLKFALWGGEENGILGSQFWVQSNPDARSEVLSYWNLDVVGMSWPAPLPQPDPVVITAGPDTPSGTSGQGGGPAAEMLAWARDLQEVWLGYPSVADGQRIFHYEGVASGQATGYAAVNAQSDHTPFIGAGIPAYFLFNGDALAGDNPVRIHSETDTLENMTKYSLWGSGFDIESPGWPSQEDQEAGRAALADSFEVAMWFPFYHAVLVDAGVHAPPGAAGVLADGVPDAA